MNVETKMLQVQNVLKKTLKLNLMRLQTAAKRENLMERLMASTTLKEDEQVMKSFRSIAKFERNLIKIIRKNTEYGEDNIKFATKVLKNLKEEDISVIQAALKRYGVKYNSFVDQVNLTFDILKGAEKRLKQIEKRLEKEEKFLEEPTKKNLIGFTNEWNKEIRFEIALRNKLANTEDNELVVVSMTGMLLGAITSASSSVFFVEKNIKSGLSVLAVGLGVMAISFLATWYNDYRKYLKLDRITSDVLKRKLLIYTAKS